MSAKSEDVMIFVAASMRACAREPEMSTTARRRSKSTDALKRCMRSDIGSAKRPERTRAGAALRSDLPGALADNSRAATNGTCRGPERKASRIRIGPTTMRATANQKPLPLRLPELRNLGTVLRILLAVNAFALLAVLAREQRWSAVPSA